MNKKYLEELYNKNKSVFEEEKELFISDSEDLEQLLIDYMVDNLQYDYDIELDIEKLFKKEC